MKVLIAEDDAASALILQRTLSKAGYQVTHAINGMEAWEIIQQESFDALLTDWMMPQMDGMELIRRVRAGIKPLPMIMVITALASPEARLHAMNSGADEYLAKPFGPAQVLQLLGDSLARRTQPIPSIPPATIPANLVRPPFVGVALVASTGGPDAVTDVVYALGQSSTAAIFVLLHGPVWMLESFTTRLQTVARMPVCLVEDGMVAEPGKIYIAPGNRHLQVIPVSFRLRLADTPPENYVRPSADPLLRSFAQAFGGFSVVAVLTGMGRDGAVGAAQVADVGGIVIAQDPATAVAGSMPQTIINLGLAREVAPLFEMAQSINLAIGRLSATLRTSAPIAKMELIRNKPRAIPG